MSDRIDRLWPDTASSLDDEAVLQNYEPPAGQWLRMNFVSSLDGAATREGLSGGLGGDGDRRVFELLRRWADVVLVGAGTAREEGYEAMRLSDEAVRWRRDRGLQPQPVFALVSGRLDLDAESAVFAAAPVRPVVYTVAAAPDDKREALAAVAEVVTAGSEHVDPVAVRADLVARGLTHVHAEGGPHLFGDFIAAGAVDELCLTIAPSLEAGESGRIAASEHAVPTSMTLASVLRAGDELLLRYTRRPS